ncbi:MAG: exodeoxyribonuclease VII small subunit [Oscillospiraceae bacterium]|nr:exodeoxyribonuclease VII small subunit [Oscillospiraceae bacterium]
MAVKKPTFEEQMIKIESIIKLLEKGDAPLAESLALFEEGTALVRSCSDMLDKAEQKVTKLITNSDGTASELPFDSEPEE